MTTGKADDQGPISFRVEFQRIVVRCRSQLLADIPFTAIDEDFRDGSVQEDLQVVCSCWQVAGAQVEQFIALVHELEIVAFFQ